MNKTDKLGASVPSRVGIPTKPSTFARLGSSSLPIWDTPFPSVALHSYPRKGDRLSTRPFSKIRCNLESILRHHLRVHVISPDSVHQQQGDRPRRSPVLLDSSTSPQSPSLTILPTLDHTQSDTLPTPHAPTGVLVRGCSPGAGGAEVDRNPDHSPPHTSRRSHANRRAAPVRRPCPPTPPRFIRG